TAAELFVTPHGSQKSFLHQVFGYFGFAYTHQSVSVKTLAVVVHPASRRLKLCRAHVRSVIARQSHIVRGICLSTLICRSKPRNLTKGMQDPRICKDLPRHATYVQTL